VRARNACLRLRVSAPLPAITLFVVLIAAFFAAVFTNAAPRPSSPLAPWLKQDTPQTAFPEMVVNLAAGRVFVVVSKGAILVGTVENPIETDTHLPVPVQIDSARAGVLMGAVEWIAPESRQQLARLDQELPHLRGQEIAAPPTLASQVGKAATDLEAVGDGVFNRLNDLVRNLHGKIDLPPDEPIAVLITADYSPGYGPEVWRLDYKFEQSEESLDYWTTRVLRPTYTQCWPPEKGQPRALLVFAYPPDKSGCPGPAPRSSANAPHDASTTGILEGDSSKVPAADATQSFRAVLDAVAPHDAREAIASIGEESGFAWILPPPAEPAKPHLQTERPAGAPSLVAPRPSAGPSLAK
jgi:hypothetical protein